MTERLPASSPRASASPAFGIVRACAILSGLTVLAWLVDAIVTSNLAGHSAWGVSALAAAICWLGAMVSMVALHVLRLRGAALAGALLGMLVRMTIPLAIIAIATMQGGALAEAGLAGQLVVFYLITLAIETCLSVVLMKSAPQAAAIGPRAEGSAPHG